MVWGVHISIQISSIIWGISFLVIHHKVDEIEIPLQIMQTQPSGCGCIALTSSFLKWASRCVASAASLHLHQNSMQMGMGPAGMYTIAHLHGCHLFLFRATCSVLCTLFQSSSCFCPSKVIFLATYPFSVRQDDRTRCTVAHILTG